MDARVPIQPMVQHYPKPDETLWARVVSFVISPPIVWAVWIYPIAFNVIVNQTEAILNATIFTFLVCIMPMLFVFYGVKKGKIGDIHMRESHERYIPYSLSIIGGLGTGLLLILLQAPAVLLILTLITCVQLTIMLVTTFFHHISAHAMAITSVTSATAIIFDIQSSLIFIPVILLVILARLVLKRHTYAQVMAGTLVGTLTPFAVILFLSLIVQS